MNEYIQDGVNGYLIDFNNPKPIDLSNIEQVQKNAYDSAVLGYENWNNSKYNIVDFIKNEKKSWKWILHIFKRKF